MYKPHTFKAFCNTKVWIVRHILQITHIVQDYTLCGIKHTVWYYTEGIKSLLRKAEFFFAFILENLHWTGNHYTKTFRGARDKDKKKISFILEKTI